MAAVEFHLHPTDRVWTRDFAPLFLKNAQGEIAGGEVPLQRLGEIR